MSNPEVINGDDPLIGSPQWYQFLEMPSTKSFRYESSIGSFTARKRPNGTWNAYRKLFGKLRQEYLGLSKSLSPERLEEIATRLAQSDMEYWSIKAQSKRERVIHKGITGSETSTGYTNLCITDKKKPKLVPISRDSSSPALQDALKKISDLEAALKESQNQLAEMEKIVEVAREVVRSMVPSKTNMVKGDSLVKLREILK
jgi:hypothetical protein